MLFRICLLSALVALAGALLEPGTFHRDALIEKPVKENGALPVVLWHGMGDSCCEPLRSVGAIKKLIQQKLGVFVLSISTGKNEASDVWSSYFGDVNAQVADVCEQIRSTPELQDGYNAVGFSQGGQFLRAVVQRCQHTGPQAHVLITLGSQHQGIMNAPGCENVGDMTAGSVGGQAACKAMQAMLSKGAYLPLVQNHVVQAQYFKDPYRIDDYLKESIFLADLNNDHDKKSEQYKKNLLSLSKLVLYRFADDKMVVPRDSSWFSFFDGKSLLALQDQAMYKEDWLGLRGLNEAGRLLMQDIAGGHMQFTADWFDQNIIQEYLSTPA